MVHMELLHYTSSKLSMLYWLELVLEWHHLPPYYRALLASEFTFTLDGETNDKMSLDYADTAMFARCVPDVTTTGLEIFLHQWWDWKRYLDVYILHLYTINHCILPTGWFFLDKQGPALIWMVCQSVNKPWDGGERTRAKWLWAIPWLSLVHDVSTAQNWHESNWSPDGIGSHPQERESWSHYWLED